MSVKAENFGFMPDGREAKLIILRGNNGIKTSITNYGSKLVSLIVLYKDRNLKDIILGYNSMGNYRLSK